MSAGILVLAGGSEFQPAMRPADRAWLDLLPSGAKVGILPTAADRRPDMAANNGVRYFRELGCNAEPVMVIDRKTASDPSLLDQIGELDAVYMAGGSPTLLATTLSDTPAWKAIVERWRGGMALGGSSAGAMVMCGKIFLRGRWEDGLGVVEGAVVLPHFNRFDVSAAESAAKALSSRDQVGIGIDESTALIWCTGSWLSAGPGRVIVLAKGASDAYRDGDEPSGLPLINV